MSEKFTIATRESKLALWQAHFVKDRLLSLHPELSINLLPMKTTGDKFLKDKLQAIGGKGLFVKELEEAMLDGRADMAVHSMKDVPAFFPNGLQLASILSRHDPFDALNSRDKLPLQKLPEKAIIGTSSLRREAQIRILRPDCRIQPLRGNIFTRINKLKKGHYDAIILATAGLERMQLAEQISQRFDETQLLPACGQGALGIECRDTEGTLKDMLTKISCSDTSLCVQTERQVNAALGGSCHVPIAIYCQKINETTLLLQAKIFSKNGRQCLAFTQQGSVDKNRDLALECAQTLINQGAHDLIQQALDDE